MNLWRHPSDDESWQHPLVRRHMALDGSRTYQNQLEHFLAVVSGVEAPLVTASDGMLTLAVTLAVAAAAREDRTVTVEEMLA